MEICLSLHQRSDWRLTGEIWRCASLLKSVTDWRNLQKPAEFWRKTGEMMEVQFASSQFASVLLHLQI